MPGINMLHAKRRRLTSTHKPKALPSHKGSATTGYTRL